VANDAAILHGSINSSPPYSDKRLLYEVSTIMAASGGIWAPIAMRAMK